MSFSIFRRGSAPEEASAPPEDPRLSELEGFYLELLAVADQRIAVLERQLAAHLFKKK